MFFVIVVALLGGTNVANGGAAVGALALGDGLAVLRGAFNRIDHGLLALALYAITFYCHVVPLFFHPWVAVAPRLTIHRRDIIPARLPHAIIPALRPRATTNVEHVNASAEHIC